MGLFDKLFGKSEDGIDPLQQLPPCKTEQELIERFGGIAFDKQVDFGDVIGNMNWNIDVGKGTISFDATLTFPIQILGTISHSSQTWLWAWANTKSNLPEALVAQALLLKKYGEENGIDLLQNSTFDFSKEKLHSIGLIASGMFNSRAYYIADYGQGAMVVTIKNDKTGKAAPNHYRIMSVFPQLISQFEINHKRALRNYLLAKGYTVLEEENSIIAKQAANTVTAEFDSLSRIIKLNG